MGVRALLPSRRIVNMFGAIGYSLLLVSYAIVAGVVLLWVMNNGDLAAVGQSPGSTLPAATGTGQDGSITSIIFEIIAYTIAGLMLIMVTFVVVSLPYWLGKSGSYLLKRVIRLCQWPVTRVSLCVGKIIACGLVTIPVLMFVMQDMSNFMMLISIGVLVGFALIVFLLQHYLARMNGLEAKEIW